MAAPVRCWALLRMDGLPQLVLPQGADQVTAEAISAAAGRLLEEQGFVAAACRVRAKIEAMLNAADVAQRITRAPVGV
jgi:hypothetical protein